MTLDLQPTTIVHEGRVGRPLDGDLREQVIGVETFSSAQVAQLMMDLHTAPERERDEVTELPYSAILNQLFNLPQGFSVIVPPQNQLSDQRRKVLQTMAAKRGMKLRLHEMAGRKLLVTVIKMPPKPEPLETLTPIQTEQLLAKAIQDETPDLRTERRYEMYGAYIRVLMKQHVEDIGAGVLYHLHDGASLGKQQTRLHLEARYLGVKIKTIQVKPGTLLLTLTGMANLRKRPPEETPEPAEAGLSMEELEG